ncbi:MAG: hypothetical protein JWM57_3603 [Phycisphaerales bacterium]|nr:hypothetical protein [Phycisphaerales bacterium]
MANTAIPTSGLDVSTPHAATAVKADAKLGYRPEIDGLRAFAVIPVILFHLHAKGFGGGSLGVDVYFVISGFQITSIVKQEADAGSFSFSKFWARRIRRIMPAMLAVTIASLLFTAFFVYRPDQAGIYRQSAWALLSGANIYFWKFVGDYWGMAAGQSPFLHMWSLAVEEQFYLFVPPAIWVVYKLSPKHLLGVVMTVLVASLAAFLCAVPKNPEAAFYLLPTRAWELAAGCALAVIGVRAKGRWQAALGLIGLALIILSYFMLPTLKTPKFGINQFSLGAMQAVLGATMVIAFARSGPAFAMLANPVAVFIGKISYSLYLWHWPVIVFPLYMNKDLPAWQAVILMTVLAVLSYYLVETPTRHAKKIVPYMIVGLLATAGIAIALAVSPRHYDTSAFEKPQLYIRAYDSNPTAPPIDHTWDTMNLLPAQVSKTAFVDGGLRTGEGDPKVVVLGDSHATFWAPVVRVATDKLNLPASFWVMSGVNPFFTVPPTKQKTPPYISPENVLKYDKARIKLLAQWHPKVVVVASRWSVKWPKELQQFIDYVSANAEHVLLIEQPPELPIGNRNVLDYLCYKGFTPHGDETQYYDVANADKVKRGGDMLKTLAATHPNVTIVPTFDLYDHGTQTRVLDGKQVVYMDDDHLTFYGASLAEGRIEQAIADAMK